MGVRAGRPESRTLDKELGRNPGTGTAMSIRKAGEVPVTHEETEVRSLVLVRGSAAAEGLDIQKRNPSYGVLCRFGS